MIAETNQVPAIVYLENILDGQVIEYEEAAEQADAAQWWKDKIAS